MPNTTKKWIYSLVDLLFPRLCCACGERLAIGENFVCASCQLQLPLEVNHDWRYNRRRVIWSDHPQLVRMGALTRYERGNRASMIVRNLKFRRQYELGSWMGRIAVQRLKESGLFEDVDLLIPIPLSKRRLHSRGFNQAELIARGMADELGIPVRTDVLERIVARESQTHFAVPERLGNAENVFKLMNSEGLQGKHVMLVDDVMTTGTTMLGAIEVLEVIADVRISTFTWAWAYMPPPVHA